MLQERQFRKCTRLEQQCQEEEHGHWQEVAQLQDKNKVWEENAFFYFIFHFVSLFRLRI